MGMRWKRWAPKPSAGRFGSLATIWELPPAVVTKNGNSATFVAWGGGMCPSWGKTSRAPLWSKIPPAMRNLQWRRRAPKPSARRFGSLAQGSSYA